MKKNFNIFCAVYGVNLFVASNYTSKEMKTLLKRKFNIKYEDYYQEDGIKGIAGSVMRFDKWPYHILWLADRQTVNGKGTKIDRVAVLAHEVFHHVLRVCSSKNIPTYPEIDNLIMDEAAAYLMEFYMREILTKLK